MSSWIELSKDEITRWKSWLVRMGFSEGVLYSPMFHVKHPYKGSSKGSDSGVNFHHYATGIRLWWEDDRWLVNKEVSKEMWEDVRNDCEEWLRKDTKRRELLEMTIEVDQAFVNGILEDTQTAVKKEKIVAVEIEEDGEFETREGKEIGRAGDYLVLENGGAEAGYVIQQEVFVDMYECVEGDTYRKVKEVEVYEMKEPFSVTPSWNQGMALHSEEDGGYLMIYGEEDFNICSFEDFDKTYEIK